MDELLRLLVAQVELVWSGVLRGDIDGRSRELGALMRSPAMIGDLVVVGSAHPNVGAARRIGWLTKIEDIPTVEDGKAIGFTRYWTIERLSGEGPYRWENVQILRVVEARRDYTLAPVHSDSHPKREF